MKIMERTLDLVDPRLMNHGKRVAFMTYRTLKRDGRYEDDFIRDACVFALLHDIGAYKTEEINEMVRFETRDVWHHSIYGYLFLKYLSPLSYLSPAILFHHADNTAMTHLHPSYRDIAGIIHIADRLDILDQIGHVDIITAKNYFMSKRNDLFNEETVGSFFSSGWEDVFGEIDADEGFDETLYYGDYTEDVTDAFMKTIVLSIDFRSPQTVTHTFGTATASDFLARRLGLPEDDIKCISTGAMLHDIGKTGIGQAIVDKHDKLTSDEYKIMQNHASMTEKILSGNIDDRIVRLACRHHEKLDGSGYPYGLHASDLTTGERVVAIGDIISALCTTRSYKNAYPKEKVVSIIRDMSERGQIDPHIVNVAVDNYDELTHRMDIATTPIINLYDRIKDEYKDLSGTVQNLSGTLGSGEIGDPELLKQAV